MRARAGFGMTEVIVASALLAVCVIPLLTMSNQGVRRANDDRARMIGMVLASNALGRFLGAPEFLTLLSHTGPNEKYSDDLMQSQYKADIGGDSLGGIATAASMQVVLHMRPSPVPNVSYVIAEARFKSGFSGITESIFLERAIITAARL